jgi:hypothetical protein
MDTKETLGTYEAPRVVDYGNLQELTAACNGGSGGDAGYPGTIEGFPGYSSGPSNPAVGCHSNP